MNIINVEIYSLIVVIILLADYNSRFKYQLNSNSKKYFRLIMYIIALSIINITMTLNPNSEAIRYTLIAIAFLLSFFPPIILYEYIEENYLRSAYYLENSKFLKVTYLLFTFIAIIVIFIKKSYYEITPLYITGNDYYNRILLFSITPMVVLFFEYIYCRIFKNQERNIRLFLVITLCILGVITELRFINLNLFTATYMVSAFLLYSNRHEEVLNRDKLTGLYNREILEQFKNNRRRSGKKMITFYMIDVDKFKHINDTYGHDKGDQILIHIASILKDSVRQSDYVVRYGGDEFLIVARISSVDNIDVIIDKIAVNIERYNKTHDIKISLSIGANIFKPNRNGKYDFKRTLKIADDKMYTLKTQKKNN